MIARAHSASHGASTMSNILFVPHGGGPLPLLGIQATPVCPWRFGR